MPLARRVLAIPRKLFDRPRLGHLTRPEVEAVLAAPDSADWRERRDRALFTLVYNTGARVSEALGVCRADLRSCPSATVRFRGKGRKDRIVPLWKATAKRLERWLGEVAGEPASPLFPNRFDRPMSRSGVEDRLARAVTAAAQRQPSLAGKRVSPHTLRHTTAMHLLQAGVDVTVIALWLGHESPETTHQYVEADVEMKRRVLDKLDEPEVKAGRPRRTESLLDFLDRL